MHYQTTSISTTPSTEYSRTKQAIVLACSASQAWIPMANSQLNGITTRLVWGCIDHFTVFMFCEGKWLHSLQQWWHCNSLLNDMQQCWVSKFWRAHSWLLNQSRSDTFWLESWRSLSANIEVMIWRVSWFQSANIIPRRVSYKFQLQLEYSIAMHS